MTEHIPYPSGANASSCNLPGQQRTTTQDPFPIRRWRDNVFVERLGRSLKYEEVSLHAYETMRDAHHGVARYVTFYNQLRPHRALDGRTSDRVYWENLPARPTAA
ncbi:MAG: transposase [Nitrospira sp.]|nr:transposase [Nitrospira sp.]